MNSFTVLIKADPLIELICGVVPFLRVIIFTHVVVLWLFFVVSNNITQTHCFPKLTNVGKSTI